MFVISPFEKIPTRLVIAVMLFTAAFMTYTMRVNISINIVAMSGQETSNSAGDGCRAMGTSNGSYTQPQGLQPDYEWSAHLQGLILSAYFWGSIGTCFFGGPLAERFGAARLVFISTAIAGVLTILAPLIVSFSVSALIVSRLLVGLCGGVIYPCLHSLVAQWAPPEEKGKFISSLMGGNVGTVVTWPLLGIIIDHLGWKWSFFFNGIIVLLWCGLWHFFVYDNPEIHPRISTEEKDFIVKSTCGIVKKAKGTPPYTKIALSLPFWALVFLHFGNLWVIFYILTEGPIFISNVLGFPIGHTGLVSGLPSLARTISGLLFGFLGDFIRKRNLLSITMSRKIFVIFSHILPGLCMLALTLVGCDVTLTVIVLVLCMGFNGAVTVTDLQNAQDLTPNFAGTVYGFVNAIGSIAGILAPLITGIITHEKNGLHEWHILFVMGALIPGVTALIFIVFGTGEVQKWNDMDEISEKQCDVTKV